MQSYWSGQMGYAIAEGAVKSGVIKGSTVIAGDPFRLESKRQKWEALGITCSRDNAKVAASCKMLILSVKPQLLGDVASVLSHLSCEQTVVSVVAGASIQSLSEMCGKANVVRVMLNTACLIGAGAVSVCPKEGTPEQITAQVEEVFKATSGCMIR